MAKRKLRIYCAFAGCSESFFMYLSSQKEVTHHILVYRGWLCNTHKRHLTPRALDAGESPANPSLFPAEVQPPAKVTRQSTRR